MHTIFLDHAKRLAYAASVSPLPCVSVSLHVHHSLILSLLHASSPKHPTIGLHRAEDMTRDVEAKEMLLTRFWDARPSLVSCWLQARSPSFHATAATGWSGSARPNCPAHHILEPSPQSPDTLRPGIEADQPDGTLLLPCASPMAHFSRLHFTLSLPAMPSRPANPAFVYNSDLYCIGNYRTTAFK